MKEKYTAPELEIIEFHAEDVITTSLQDLGGLGEIGGNNDNQHEIP